MATVDETSRPRLGRGLAALIGDSGGEVSVSDRSRGQRRAPTAFLRGNPRNPRKHFDDDELGDLANSIRERGVIQPIVVRALRGSTDHFEIIAGERRWRAAQRAGLHDVPIIVVEAGDKEALELAIIENVQRADLNALEEAQGYEQLIAEFTYSQNDLAKIIGKSRSHVANTLRLLKLPESVRVSLAAGDISAGHARSLLSIADPDLVAKQIVAQGLTVRDVERIAQSEQAGAGKKPAAAKPTRDKGPDIRAMEAGLSEALGLVVNLDHRDDAGEIRIRYKSLAQFEAVCAKLRA